MNKQKKQIKLKSIPHFATEDEERDFWATHDSTDYFDYSHPIRMDFSRLKLSAKPVTVRLPLALLSDLRTLANKRDVPYQSLLKIFLAERLEKEMRFYAEELNFEVAAEIRNKIKDLKNYLE